MKKNIVTIITAIAYIMLVAGVIICFMGVQEYSISSAHREASVPYFVTGISLIVCFPFAMGFRYVVEAAVTYMERAARQKKES